MQLTVFSDLSLRIIMRMAAGEVGRKYTSAGIADELNASDILINHSIYSIVSGTSDTDHNDLRVIICTRGCNL